MFKPLGKGRSKHHFLLSPANSEKSSHGEHVYWKENLVWSPGYFVSTIGLNEEQIIKYIKWQESQDLGQATCSVKSATGLPVGIYVVASTDVFRLTPRFWRHAHHI
jgi:hypothetical protein